MPGGVGRKHLSTLVLHLLDFFFYGGDDVIEFLDFFEEVCYVEESVAIEADFHEGRLHAGKHAGDSSLVNTAD
jgi:hypothetical protein